MISTGFPGDEDPRGDDPDVCETCGHELEVEADVDIDVDEDGRESRTVSYYQVCPNPDCGKEEEDAADEHGR